LPELRKFNGKKIVKKYPFFAVNGTM